MCLLLDKNCCSIGYKKDVSCLFNMTAGLVKDYSFMILNNIFEFKGIGKAEDALREFMSGVISLSLKKH